MPPKAARVENSYPAKAGSPPDTTNRRGYWQEQISKANKRWETFEQDGDAVMDRYNLQSKAPDKYNILYSSTETIKPSLYGQTPKVEVKTRQQDTENELRVAAAMLLEQVGQYAVDQLDFDYTLQNVVSDYVLPGIGNVWVRYDPKFTTAYDNDNQPLKNDDGTDQEYLTFEGIALDYVHFKDFRTGLARYWHEVPWVSRRTFLSKKQATKRFGKEKANKLKYSFSAKDKHGADKTQGATEQAVIYEIWDKTENEVVWYSEDYPDDVIDSKPDPLRLENFFPCPRPLRAVWTTRSIIPKSLYSQYKTQAAELDRLTERIRYLTEALKVRGLYDGSQAILADVLDGVGNKMIPIQDWVNFMQNGGITGVVQWVPIEEVVKCLSELFKQREICKNEIYEISGFSDIVRGVSKASETLGAQQIKADWATGRLKDMQREVQRFCRDIIRMFIDIAAGHFSDKTLMLYSGVTIPEPTQEEIQATQQAMQQGMPAPPTQAQQIQQAFQAVVKMIRSDKLRCAAVGIETDSTILPDEQKERQDRMQFLSSMGAFLQQAAPMAMQFPDMRGLLGGIMMFTLRTFSASRPLEKEFESFQKKLEAAPPTPPPGEGGDNGEAKAAADKEIAGIKAEADKATSSEASNVKRYEIDQRTQLEQAKARDDHQYRMAMIRLEREKVDLERQKLGLGVLGEERQFDHDKKSQTEEAINTIQEGQEDRAQEAELEAQRQAHEAELQAGQQAHEAEQGDADRTLQEQQATEALNATKNKPAE